MKPTKDLTVDQATDLARYFLGPEAKAMLLPTGEHIIGLDRKSPAFIAPTWRAVFRAAGIKLPIRPRFISRDRTVIEGPTTVATAVSKTMARRIASALNKYHPNSKGY